MNPIIHGYEYAAELVAKEQGDAYAYMNFISRLNNCNTCKDRKCKHRPKLGDPVRINCFAWQGIDD